MRSRMRCVWATMGLRVSIATWRRGVVPGLRRHRVRSVQSVHAEAIARNGRLQASVRGTGKDDGPSCATVPLLSAWTVATTA